jgi:pSer/pThr/pTyr-binding forkhead associated (FHA) protein
MFKQFDIIQLKTTKRVKWMSGPPNQTISPKGNWSVVGILGEELVVCKDSTIIRIPHQDTIKIGDYRIEKLLEEKENTNGEEKREKREKDN